MAGVNKVILVGHLGRDPEVRTLNSGGQVVSFSMATSESWRDKDTGDRKDRTQWHNVVIFNEGLGKIAEAYLKKGSQVYIEGSLLTRTYTDRDGQERKTTEIVLARYRGELSLISGQRSGPGEDSYGTPSTRPAQQLDDPREAMAAKPQRTADFIDDDIPF
ncbi:single-stranded DNA-binding protein [Methylocella silvestris]|uniref:Single-stranded DNA-binding protein n=1 Tax=Methylocella silvestris TaxID=199596 RepID=A0A2J7TJT9_METSI|nr:single-stranded DNA-binding protein [Methylocella silvestris]PNG27034.1 single-stranded DNA-binding protein [Methylocella silvestris]